MKVQRWDPPRSFPTKALAWIPCDDGDWCDSDDVVQLEQRMDELEASNAKLIQALEAIIKLGERIPDPTYEVEIAKTAISDARGLITFEMPNLE